MKRNWIQYALGLALLLAVPAGWAAGPGAAEAGHVLPLHAVELGRVGGFPITNSMVATWLVAVGLILAVRWATRRMRDVPEGAQNFWEWLIEGLYEFLADILGPTLIKKTFWFFATVFLFILSCNWFALIPGVGTIGWGHASEHGFIVTQPFFRGANADLNLTLAMAMVFFGCWTVWALQVNGVKGFLLHIFGPKGETTGALKVLMVLVFMAVGVLEVISILFRPVSLSLRLFGNIYAGENLLEAMSGIVPALGWLIPVPFYFLELLVGVVQALVFMLLTAVFTLLICQHDEEAEEAHSS